MTSEQTPESSPNLTDQAPYTEKATVELLLKILYSEKFQRALTITAGETKESGYETAFRLILDVDHNPLISKVLKGGTISVGSVDDEVLEEMDYDYMIYSDPELGTPYIDLHFHPHDEAEPSTVDIEEIFGNSDPADRPAYQMICIVDEDSNIHALCLVNPGTIIVREDIEVYARSMLRGKYDPLKVIENLSKIEIEAFCIDFVRDKNRKKLSYSITTESEKSITSHNPPAMIFSTII